MNRILILDVETSTLSTTTGRLTEVAVAPFSLEFGRHIKTQSWLVKGETNEAFAVNGIPPGMLAMGDEFADVMLEVHALYLDQGCDVIVSHNTAFDRQWFTPEIQKLPWACSCEDMEWPRESGSRSLAAIALAHGVGVVDAHRAGPDVATMVRLFERVNDMGADIPAMIARALRPKVKLQALVSYETNQLAKDARFRWYPGQKMWLRSMPIEDSVGLPFAVKEVA